MKISITPILIFLLCAPVRAQWQVNVSRAADVGNPVGYPLFQWFPDGHITVLPDGDEYIMFWSEYENHRSVGPTQFVEDQKRLDPADAVFGKRGNFDTYDNGGSWMMSVFRQTGDKFIGFFHAEDHWFPHTTNDIAWKSIGVVYSNDEGKTWVNPKQIITSANPKPSVPTWGGTGDCCVVWDPVNKRWMCYFQEHFLSMAISTDPEGKPGTWKKYFEGEFTEDGLGGRQSPLPSLRAYPGGNPSVHWNTYLSKWVMTWHGWDPPRIYVAVSDDGITWDRPISIIASDIGGRAWYPTIIGETDVQAGQIAKIYYADIAANFTFRRFKVRTITFIDPNNSQNTTARIDLPKEASTISTRQVEIKTSIENVKAPIEKVEFYAGSQLIGTDTSFPFGLNWSPTQQGAYAVKAVYTDSQGRTTETQAVNIVFDYVLGLDDHRQEADFSAYPSPTGGQLLLDGLPTGAKKILIYDTHQKLVYEDSIMATKWTIDMHDFAVGMYVVHVVSNQYVLKKKIMKM